MENGRIDVSICCLVYNHEKYLRQCLDGFMMQKDVTFEVLIHDDASTDSSADIIREYEKKYPDIIKPIYQKENQYSKGVELSLIDQMYQYPRAKGKYIAICEGDDFWTDPYKLKKQYDALENNPECGCCFARVQGVACDGKKKLKKYPLKTIHTGLLRTDDYYQIIDTYPFPFQISGFFIKTEAMIDFYKKEYRFQKISPAEDFAIFLYAGTLGPIYYFNKTMSCYRRGVQNSWTNRKHIGSSKRFIDSITAFEEETNDLYKLENAKNRSISTSILQNEGCKAAYNYLKKCKNKNIMLKKMELKFFISYCLEFLIRRQESNAE